MTPKQFSDEQFLEAVKSLHFSSSGDVAKYVGCSRDLAQRRLSTLVGDGQIKRTLIGKIWMYRI